MVYLLDEEMCNHRGRKMAVGEDFVTHLPV